MLPVVIIGAGDFGREAIGLISDINEESPRYELLGLLDDSPSVESRRLCKKMGYEILGGLEWLEKQSTAVAYTMGIARPAIRKRIVQRFADRCSPTLIHPSVQVRSTTVIGEGSIVCSRTSFMENCTVGRYCHINQMCSIGHDSALADFCTVYPMAAISGSVTLAPMVQVGAHATIVQGLSIGHNSFVGAAACVVKDVPDQMLAIGVPARYQPLDRKHIQCS